MKHHHNLVWIDCEMTGLDFANDVILEIACVITDGQLNVIAEGPSLVIHRSDEVLAKMNSWCQVQHRKSGLYTDVQQSTVTVQEAEKQIVEFLTQYVYRDKAPLCGSSVWVDRLYIQKEMPKIINFLHYRNVDVATVKELAGRWYHFDIAKELPKQEVHRAKQDILDSINELRYYRDKFFIPPTKEELSQPEPDLDAK